MLEDSQNSTQKSFYILSNISVRMEVMRMVLCQNCGAENLPDSRYCENCGALIKAEESHTDEVQEYIKTYEGVLSKVEESLSKPVVRVVLSGLLVAFIGGLIWSIIVIVTGYEIGYMAVGLGIFAGIVVTKYGTGCKMSTIKSAAIGSSILGIFFGKFIAFYYSGVQLFREILIAEGLTEAEASLVSPSFLLIFKVFFQNLPEIFGIFGLIWVILALISAWRLPDNAKKRM